ncbi:MAG TPA: ABC transporter substrate-binding protein [Opitutales bacterium]|nr:ABC transporter substrate-binding protein [Opitutales bacterium]
MTPRFFVRGLAAAVFALALAGCGQPSSPATPEPPSSAATHPVTDGAGRTVSLPATPLHIVSLSPAATDILVAENAQAQIAGVTRYCVLPAADNSRVARVGGIVDPDYERIVALRPDLVIIPWLADKTLQNKLAALGLNFVVLHPEGLAGTLADLRLVGAASGHAAAGEARAKSIEDLRALVTQRLHDVPADQRPRVLIIMDEASPAPGSYVDDLLAAAGGRNALPTGGRAWLPVAPESILQLAPDLIVAIPPLGSTPAALPPTTAKIVTITDSAAFYHPGPNLGQALWSLAHALYPARFPEPNPPPPRP